MCQMVVTCLDHSRRGGQKSNGSLLALCKVCCIMAWISSSDADGTIDIPVRAEDEGGLQGFLLGGNKSLGKGAYRPY